MNFELSTDQLSQQIYRRFTGSRDTAFDEDFYVDLLCVFNDPKRFNAADFMDYPVSAILVYLKKTHEFYTSESLQAVSNAIENLAKGNSNLSALKTVLDNFFSNFRSHLEIHIKEEEETLFPYVERLINAEAGKASLSEEGTRSILTNFLEEHDDDLELGLKDLVVGLNALSKKYHDDSFAFRMLVNKISILELDLNVHGKIEEHVLIPKAFALEKKLLGS